MLDRPGGELLRRGQVGVSVGLVAERAFGQARQLPGVPIGEGDHDPVRREGVQAGQWIGGEARLALFAVGEDRGARLFEPPDGLGEGLGLQFVECFGADLTRREPSQAFDQVGGTRDAADRLGGKGHAVLQSLAMITEPEPTHEQGFSDT